MFCQNPALAREIHARNVRFLRKVVQPEAQLPAS